MALQPAVVGLARCANTRSNYITTALAAQRAVRCVVYVNSTDRSHKVDRYTIEITDDLNEAPNTFSFECFGFTPALDQVVKIYYGGPTAKEFEGTITGLTEYHDKLNARIVFRVTGTDYTRLLDADLVTKAYGSQSATTTAQDIITNFTSGFTQVNIAASLATVAAIQFKMTPVSSALRQLCDAFGGDAYVDYDKDVHVFLTETSIVPDTISTATSNWRTVKYSRMIDRLANRVDVEGMGSTVTSRVSAGATSVRVDDIATFSDSGGLAVTGNQILSYTGKGYGDAATATWIASSAPRSAIDVTWADTIALFVAVGVSGFVMTSPDGTTWTGRTASEANTWESVVWAPSLALLVAVGANGTNRVMTSPDGITWTARTAASAVFWKDLVWAPSLSLFVAVSTNSSSAVMTSPDGTTWTGRTAASVDNWFSVAWSPSLTRFVAVAQNSGSTNTVMTSPDGTAWTLRTASVAGQWIAVAWSPSLNLFAALSNTAQVMTSPDGITWTTQTVPTLATGGGSLIWSPELALFVAVGVSSTAVMTSPDGITWTVGLIPSDSSWGCVAWSSTLGRLVAVSGAGGVVATSGATALAGIPASGTGSILSAIAAGDEINILIRRDDATSQATYGIRKTYIQDRRLSISGAQARGDAELTLRKDPFTSGVLFTTDTKVRSGRRLTISLASEWGISGTFTIMKVRMFFKEGDQRLQREVTFASNTGQSDLYRLLRRLREGQQQQTGA